MPLLVKIAPDLGDEDVLAVADLALAIGLDGIIATNTTISREHLASDRTRVEEIGAGGLSGAPLRSRALEVTRLLRERVGPDLTLVGVGGISDAADARARLAAGADAGAGLHRVRLRRTPLAGPGRARTGRRLTAVPVHVDAEVIATRRAGAYRVLSLAAPGVADGFRPGMFVAVSVGAGSLARRALWIHRVRESGTHGACLDVVVEPRGEGGTWLAGRRLGDRVPLTGPLGRPFALPREPVACLLVGEGVAAASLFTLAERLRERACPVTHAGRRRGRGAPGLDPGGPATGPRGDGGDRGRVGRHQGQRRGRAGTGAGEQRRPGRPTPPVRPPCCAPWPRWPAARSLSAQVALAPPMPCGTGLCGACLVPVQDSVGAAHWVRGLRRGTGRCARTGSGGTRRRGRMVPRGRADASTSR